MSIRTRLLVMVVGLMTVVALAQNGTFVVTAILILSGALIGWFSATRLVEPLARLRVGVTQIGDGDLTTRVESHGGGPEIENLVNALNVMAFAVDERDRALRGNMAVLAVALESAKEASRLKSEFLATVAHELRTPLNAIVNIPASLLQEMQPSCPDCDPSMQPDALPIRVDLEKHFRFLLMLQTAGRHLLAVVSDILDFSKLEAGKMKLFAKEVLIERLLQETENTMRPLAKDKDIALVFHLVPGTTTLVADPVKLSQMLINLIGNAIKFTPDQGRVEVTVDDWRAASEPMVEFSVRDTGIGIPADRLGSIFERFRQLDGDHPRQVYGTGLGLSITRKLVELHGGSIFVSSEPGKGSTFTLRLPARGKKSPQEESEPPALAPEARGKAGRHRVMIIDDDPFQLQLTNLVLQQEGFETILVNEAGCALGRIAAEMPDAIILDVMMPNVSGLDILKSVKGRSETAAIPVFVCTAYHGSEGPTLKLGGCWLPKPWSRANMVSQLRSSIHS